MRTYEFAETLVGRRFGMLIVESVGRVNDRSVANVVCDCGRRKTVLVHGLRYAGTKSCGRHKSNKYNLPDIANNAQRGLLRTYKRTAEKNHRTFMLDNELVFSLFEQPCYYCGQIQSSESRYGNDSYRYNGIDRVDNTRGYEPDNVVTCCNRCNKAKLTMTLDEFASWIDRVYNILRQRGEIA